MRKPLLLVSAALLSAVFFQPRPVPAIEIPLESLSPVRIGFIDLQRVFDGYPEKSFAEGDLLREIEKRKRELNRRQTEVSTLRRQIALDEAAYAQARDGQSVNVPENLIPEPQPAKTPTSSTGTVTSSSAPVVSTTTVIEPYPTQDPLAGLPGHEGYVPTAKQNTNAALPGMEPPRTGRWTTLDQLSRSKDPVTLDQGAMSQLQDRIAHNKRALDRVIGEFRNFRTNAVGDMKQLQTEKTHGLMARIYATLQNLARDEGIAVVLDKAYVLYGEEGVDLSEKLIERLQAEAQ
jgi:Skp family chaperone for outer membrane proteins